MNTNIGSIYSADSLDVTLTITDQETRRPLDLTDATLSVAANAGGTVVAGEGAASHPLDGKAIISFAAGSFLNKSGNYTAHVRVTKGLEVQTVAAISFAVIPSVVAPV